MSGESEVQTLVGTATFDHVAHALPSIRASLPLYRDVLGGELVHVADMPRVGYRVAHLAYAAGTKIELIEALPGSSFLDKFFERNPAGGLHHITFRVPDVAASVAAAKRAGYEVFGVSFERPQWKEAFVHPRVAHGALVQFAEIAPGYPLRMTVAEAEAALDRGPSTEA